MKMHRTLLRQFALAVTALAVGLGGLAATASAATYYSAPAGSDSNPGTLPQPFRTLAKGLTVLKPGDTLYLRGGSYKESISDLGQPVPSGTAGQPITIAAYPTETVTIGGTGSYAIVDLNATQYLTFTGDPGSAHNLVFDGTNTSRYGLNFKRSNGATPPRPLDTHITVQNFELKNLKGGEGILTFSNYVSIVNGKIHDLALGTATSGIHGIYIEGAYTLIDGNEVYNCPDFGIQVYNGYVNTDNHDTIVRNNLVHDNAKEHTYGHGGITVNSGDNNLIYNNVIYNNQGDALSVSYNSGNTGVYQNTLVNNAGFGLVIGNGGSRGVFNTRVANNILFQNTYQIMNLGTNTTFTANLCGSAGTGCARVGDPQFVNASTANFRLQATSPALDAGTTLTVVPSDLAHAVRPQGAGYDLGAYEMPGRTLAPPTNFRLVQVTP